MAGHSKWANIRHRKERVDNKRGKVFSRLVKEISIAAKLGGEDPLSNPRLRLALTKAKEANLPKDNIEKAIKRGSGQLDGVAFEEVRYEGYGPEGIAILVDCQTDNRNRSTAEVRHAFTRHGGNLGTDGSVAFMFERVGQILYAPSDETEKIINFAIEAGARDFITADDGSVELVTEADEFHEVLQTLEKEIPPYSAELVMRPQMPVQLDKKQEEKVRKLLDALEDCDDTQQVYCNANLAD